MSTATTRCAALADARWARLLGPVAALALLIGSSSLAHAQKLDVRLLSRDSSVEVGALATVTVQTVVGANCGIRVHYDTGPSKAKGLEAKAADAQGRVGWTWRVAPAVTPGKWPIKVACSAGERRGWLDTWFIVRAKKPY